MLRVVLISIAVLAVAAPVAGAHYAKHGKRCGAVATTPNSDDGASAIRATGVKCRKARRIARAYERGNEGPGRFTCVASSHDSANLAHRDVECTRGERRVTFASY